MRDGGAWRRWRGNLRCILLRGRAILRAGQRIAWHSLEVSVVAGRGYSRDFMRVDWRASQLVAGGRGWERRRSAQCCAFRRNSSKVVDSFPSGRR